MLETPPLSTDALTFHFPPVEDAVLADGTPLHVIQKSKEDLVTVTVYLRSGTAHDVYTGATAFAGELLTRRTQRRGSEHLAEAIDSLGASIRGSAEKTTFRLSGLCLADTLPDMVALMGECFLEPGFDQDELDALREQWIGELLMDQHDPSWLAGRALARVSFQGHPFLADRRGSISDMRGLTVEHIKEAHRRILHAPRLIIVAGPVDAATIAPYLEKAFGTLPVAQERPSLARARLTEGAGCIAVNAEAVQSSLFMSLPCPSFDHPDYPAVQLVTHVLGGFTLARLFMVLREEKGYTYGAYAKNAVWEYFSSTDIMVSVGNEFTQDTFSTIHRLVREIASNRIDDEELENARQDLLGMFARSNETPQQVAALLWKVIQHGLPSNYFPMLIQRIQSYTPDDLLQVQERWFNADRWVIGASGQPSVLLPAMEPYASPIEVWSVAEDNAA